MPQCFWLVTGSNDTLSCELCKVHKAVTLFHNDFNISSFSASRVEAVWYFLCVVSCYEDGGPVVGRNITATSCI